MKAIIIAGGKGRRLRPLTCNIPKPMMPIMGKPVMQYTIELLKKMKITDIGVTLQYLPDSIINYFGDGRKFGVNIRYFIEDSPLGTAGSVKNAQNFLEDTFVVISGDALTDINILEAIKFHEEKKAMVTMVLKEVPVPLEYGVVITNKECKIKGFLEKPTWGEVFSDKVNTGIYILEPEIFNYYKQNQKFDFSNDLFPKLLETNNSMYGYVAKGYWCDIGNIEQYINCHYDILKEIVKVKIKGEKYKQGVWIGENCEINPSANIIPPVYFGNGSKIYEGSRIGPYSVTGKNNIISSRATIKRSILFDNCYVGNNSEVRGAVLCNKVQLESKSFIFEDTAIGEETLIGGRSVIKPNIKIWPNKVIESGSIVKNNVIWSEKYNKSLFGKKGITGEVNIDITPEVVSKMGSAFGSLLEKGAKIAISCNDSGAAQMFKYSLATGLLSIGAEVYDLKVTTISMTRQITTFFGLQGAIHVTIEKDDCQNVNILFIDKNGLDIDRHMEKKIESSFFREDFRRVKADEFKKIIHLSDCIECYIRQLTNKLKDNNIRNQKYRVVLNVKNKILKNVLKSILDEIKVNVEFCENCDNEPELSKKVVSTGANLGAYILDDSDFAILIDEKGNRIQNDTYEALKALVLLKTTKIKTLVVPVTASSILEEMARMCGAKFIRSKTSQNNILQCYLRNEKDLNEKQIRDYYLMTLDSISILIFTINLMAQSNISLSKLLYKVPTYFNKKQEIHCPWSMKGKVMRSLIEDSNSKSIDLIEGVKLNFDNAWALVLPDEDEPLCRVYVESKEEKKVKSISSLLNKRICDITGTSSVNKDIIL